jgi:hypothetical protein
MPGVEITFCDESPLGFGWIASEPEFMLRASHALACEGRVWLIDPVDGPGVAERIEALGPVAGVVQLLDRHNRDCAEMAARHGAPLQRLPEVAVPGSPFQAIRTRWMPGWREVALWWPEARVLVCADVLGTAGYFRAPGEAMGLHPMMRLTPPRRLRGLDPEQVLVGHGAGIIGPAAAPALAEALATARRRTPSWLWNLARTRGRGAT